jgi:hypothetical protein
MALDTQRQRVYDWERKYIPRIWGQKLTELECQDLMLQMANHYGLAVPKLELKHMRKWAGTYYYFGNRITLNPTSGMNRGTVIHEMAHAICHAWHERTKSAVLQDGGHGDYFMAAYLDALARFGGFTPDEMAALRANADPNNFEGSRRRDIPRVACCAVFEDPTASPDMARRSMKCVECDYPWFRHDMPFHRHDCGEAWFTKKGKMPNVSGLAPGQRRARVVEAALEETQDLGWTGSYWSSLRLCPTLVPFRPTVADHVRKAEGQKAAGHPGRVYLKNS